MTKKTVSPLVAALSALLAAAVLTGCGGDDGAVSAGPAPGGATGTEALPQTPPDETVSEPTGTTAQEPPPEEAERRYQVWLVQDDALFLTWVDGPATAGVAAEAVRLLLGTGGGSGAATTAIPPETRLLGIDLDAGVATVDLSSEFESGGGSRSMFLRLAQVVYTVTQFETVNAVRFRLDGEPVEVFSGEGIVLDGPVGRRDYEDLLPAIVVLSPAWDEEISSPVLVYGNANVFEANVTVRILGADGEELAHTFTTATCGTGCRGTFSLEVPFSVEEAQEGTIVVHDDDAAGTGTPPHQVRIPVRLTPGS
jgi:Immunoglobulin-like domain of bacterial spore germination/Sporulation and spore germination